MVAETAIATSTVASAPATSAATTTAPAAAIAAATTSASPAAATSAAIATPTPAATTAFWAWACFVYCQVTAIETVAVKGFSRGIGFFFRGHRHEGEPAGTTAHAVEHQVAIGDGSVLGEKILKIVFCDVVGKVSYEQLGIHSYTIILEITPAKRAPPLGSASDLLRIFTTFARSRI